MKPAPSFPAHCGPACGAWPPSLSAPCFGFALTSAGINMTMEVKIKVRGRTSVWGTLSARLWEAWRGFLGYVWPFAVPSLLSALTPLNILEGLRLELLGPTR